VDVENHDRWGGAHRRHLANTMNRFVQRRRFGLLLPLLQQRVLSVDVMNDGLRCSNVSSGNGVTLDNDVDVCC